MDNLDSNIRLKLQIGVKYLVQFDYKQKYNIFNNLNKIGERLMNLLNHLKENLTLISIE
jgi:hypothetical protein